jgi:hypothetical protein
MSKKTFIFILFILSFNYLENKATSSFLNKDILLIAQWIWCFLGLAYFRNQRNNSLNTLKNRRYIIWFLLIMFISTLAPYFEYNQPIFGTLISQRANYSICTLIVLLYIHPSENDIFSNMKILALLSVGLFFYSIINPLFFLDTEIIESRLELRSTDIGLSGSLPGFMLLTTYFYYVGYNLIKNRKKNLNELYIFLLLMSVIILIQNRQTIIITLPIFVYSIYKIKSEFNKYLIILILIIVIIVLGSNLNFLIESLIEETNNQVGDSDYNRWQAIYAFLFEWKYSLFNFFFGHGVNSLNSKYTLQLNQFNHVRGAYYQDIGFLGSFFLYGILFIILNYYFIFQGFFKKQMPLYLKFWCFGLILIPIFQNWGMMNNNSAVLFAFLFYLVIYNKQYNKIRFQESYSK